MDDVIVEEITCCVCGQRIVCKYLPEKSRWHIANFFEDTVLIIPKYILGFCSGLCKQNRPLKLVRFYLINPL